MTRSFRFLFALAWKAAIMSVLFVPSGDEFSSFFVCSFPYLFSFGTLALGLQIRVDIDIN